MKNKHILNIEKLAKVLGIRWKKTSLLARVDKLPQKKTYSFALSEKRQKPSATLLINPDLPRVIYLSFELKNGYRSSILFENITKVAYLPKYRAVRIENHRKTRFSVLKIYARGQFDLSIGLKEKEYLRTVWAQNSNT